MNLIAIDIDVLHDHKTQPIVQLGIWDSDVLELDIPSNDTTKNLLNNKYTSTNWFSYFGFDSYHTAYAYRIHEFYLMLIH